jgi:hypothetical protein
MKKTTINPDKIKTRDHLLVALICGATKGGAEKNHRREANRNKCRGRYRGEE